MKILSTGQTDVGMKRQGNEDSFMCDDSLGLFVVADGMGGHAAGEVASRTAIQAISQEVSKRLNSTDPDETDPGASSVDTDPGPKSGQHFFEYSVHLANRCIVELSKENPIYNGMGTTVSGMLISDNTAIIAHVGDSRIYMLRNDELKILTTDHSWVNEQLQRNIITAEEARTHRWRNVITRALGNRIDLEVDVINHELQVGDTYMLCSDGLTGMVEDNEIKQVLNELQDPEQAVRKLIDLANDYGGTDNITAIVLKVVD